jgi:hypothetical protein
MDIDDSTRLNQLTPEQLQDVSLGLSKAYDFRIYIRRGRFWLEHLDGGAITITGKKSLAKLFSTAREAHELAEIYNQADNE